MKIKEPGHIYLLSNQDVEKFVNANETGGFLQQHLTFVNREGQNDHPGTQTQEVLRVLIDRTMHCDNCLPWDGNISIIHHMRMAIVYHEARALLRKAEKGLYLPELVTCGPDGHFELQMGPASNDSMKYHIRRPPRERK